MKTLSLTLRLCAAAIVAAILAPVSTSSTTELSRLKKLEQKVAQLQEHARCINAGIPVTSYGGTDGTHYLAATRHTWQKSMWVVVMTPGCLSKHPKPSELGWKW